MLFRIFLTLTLITGVKEVISYVRRLIDENRYNNQDVDRFIDSH